MNQNDISTLWRRLLIDVAFTRKYNVGYFGNQLPVKNPVVERLLPSLLHVKAVAILDRAITVPKNTLYERIKCVGNNHYLTDPDALHTVRGSRNDVAHEPADSVDWSKLNGDVTTIHGALRELGFVDEFPVFTVRAKRSAAGAGRVPNTSCTWDYSIGVFENERVVAEPSWAEHLMQDGA